METKRIYILSLTKMEENRPSSTHWSCSLTSEEMWIVSKIIKWLEKHRNYTFLAQWCLYETRLSGVANLDGLDQVLNIIRFNSLYDQPGLYEGKCEFWEDLVVSSKKERIRKIIKEVSAQMERFLEREL